MSEAHTQPAEGEPLAEALRHALARGEGVLAAVGPMLRHVLAYGDMPFLADDVLARIRGMLADLARQLAEQAPALAPADIAAALPEAPGLLGHLQALALEDMLAQRLAGQIGLDPVVSPLIQALIGSSQSETQALAMRLLAAQTRFVRQQQRMQLPLAELPAEVLHAALACLGGPADAFEPLRQTYDEAQGRLALAARLIAGMGAGAVAALQLGHGGVALFASALGPWLGGEAGWRGRDHAVLAMQKGQEAALGLALRSGGLKPALIDETLLMLHPGLATPLPWGSLSPERAASLLQAGHCP